MEKDRIEMSQRERGVSCFGEMVQADASEHDWLEGRGPMLSLVGLIDDAAGDIFHGKPIFSGLSRQLRSRSE